jgi:hypothetical protein
MQLTGTKEIMDALKDLDAKMTASVLRTVAKKALNAKAIETFRNNSISNRAKNSIKIVSVKGSKTAVLLGPDKKSFFEIWLQKGTVNRTTKKGWNRGMIKPNFKLDNAVDQTIDPIIEYYNEELGKEVQKILERKLRNTKNRISKLK